MDWISAGKLAIGALSGSSTNVSMSKNEALSGIGVFGSENNLKVKSATIDLTEPTNLIIGFLAAVSIGYLVKRGFK